MVPVWLDFDAMSLLGLVRQIDEHDLVRVFGSPLDPMSAVEKRAEATFQDEEVIVWEGDPATFRFSFVGAAAARVLGYPSPRWTEEPTFWADHVVHPDDQRDAVAYCALATCKGADHTFEYRARRADGGVVWLLDIVRVILSERNLPVTLRGIMFDVSDLKREAGTFAGPSRERSPSREALAERPDAGS